MSSLFYWFFCHFPSFNWPLSCHFSGHFTFLTLLPKASYIGSFWAFFFPFFLEEGITFFFLFGHFCLSFFLSIFVFFLSISVFFCCHFYLFFLILPNFVFFYHFSSSTTSHFIYFLSMFHLVFPYVLVTVFSLETFEDIFSHLFFCLKIVFFLSFIVSFFCLKIVFSSQNSLLFLFC